MFQIKGGGKTLHRKLLVTSFQRPYGMNTCCGNFSEQLNNVIDRKIRIILEENIKQRLLKIVASDCCKEAWSARGDTSIQSDINL